MPAISRTGSIASALCTPIIFLISKKRFATDKEIQDSKQDPNSNYLKNASVLTWLGIGSVALGIISGLISRFKESSIAKTIGKIFGFGGILVTALGIFNEAAIRPPIENNDSPKPLTTALAVIDPKPSPKDTNGSKNTSSGKLVKAFKYCKEKIIQGIRSNTFSFLDDPEINGIIGNVLGVPGVLFLDVLRILRHSTQVGGAIATPEEQASLRRCYETLGVSEDASFEEIKAAHRKLARQYHPDTSPLDKKEAEELFKELQNAYDILEKKLEQQRKD